MTEHLDVIGHRGLRRSAPENTIAAFQAAAELARIDAGGWFSERFRGEPVPTLQDVLDWALTNTLTLHLELKDAPTMSGEGLVGASDPAVALALRSGPGGVPGSSG